MANVQLAFSLISKKHFDTVDHDILLNKLYNYGIRGGLPWNGSKVTFQIDIKLLNIMIMNQKLEKYCVESHRGLY